MSLVVPLYRSKTCQTLIRGGIRQTQFFYAKNIFKSNLKSHILRKRMLFLLAIVLPCAALAGNNLALTPPMGWMSWEIFRCNLATATDNCTDPLTTACISEALYKGQADAMISGGFVEYGYNSIHMDDCWEVSNYFYCATFP